MRNLYPSSPVMHSRNCWDRPFGSRMVGHVVVQDASGFDFHDDEHVDQLERCRHNDKKVTGNNRLCVVADEGHPALLGIYGAPRFCRHVAPNCAGRNLDADFQQQFIFCNSVAVLSSSRAIRTFDEYENVPVVGSYSSAVLILRPSLFLPAAISTCPLGSNVTV